MTVLLTNPPRLRLRPLLPLLLLFFGSGCAALIYEIVWFQMLQLVIGSWARRTKLGNDRNQMQADRNSVEQPRNKPTKTVKLCSFVALLFNHSALERLISASILFGRFWTAPAERERRRRFRADGDRT
jgi:hypothetical protein